ncbi:MAG: VanW family protein [Clostridiales bacterium]|nr:VanW family protein [Clostridiales bacterium]
MNKNTKKAIHKNTEHRIAASDSDHDILQDNTDLQIAPVQIPSLRKNKGQKVVISIFVALFAVAVLTFVVTAAWLIFKYDKIYQGISIEGVDVGGKTYDEVRGMLLQEYVTAPSEMEIKIVSPGLTRNITFKELNVKYDIDGAVNEAYKACRNGSIFNRIFDLYKLEQETLALTIPLSYDKDTLSKIIDSYYEITFVEKVDYKLTEIDGNFYVSGWRKGEAIDKAELITALEELISKRTGGEINAEIIFADPQKPSFQSISDDIYIEAIDACTKVLNNSVEIIPHIVGRTADAQALSEIFMRLEAEGNITSEGSSNSGSDNSTGTVKSAGTAVSVLAIPVKELIPEITTDIAKTMLFRDKLATYSTYFSTSDTNNINRGENIKLSVSKIDGKILAAGEEFSFNNVVGPRSEEEGYKTAHIYVAGRIIDGIGGGICQVSTTLYNTVLFSDLEVTERRNHSFTVPYVPKGRDATVSYGTQDFKFKNSTPWPVKISAWVTKENRVYFSIEGTNLNPPERTLGYEGKTIKTIDFKLKYVDDPTLLSGTTIVKQEGMKGYTVETYKIVKVNGEEISREFLHTSTYRALDKEILKGTKVSAAAVVAPTSSPVSPGVDDADNPPAEATPTPTATPDIAPDSTTAP